MLKKEMTRLTRQSRATMFAVVVLAGSPVPSMAQSPAEAGPPTQPGQAPARTWFGFSIACSNCRKMETATEERWDFSVAPSLLAIAPGSPAANAGLLAGDVLTHIDGVSLTTEAGAARLASVRPGDQVTFSARRDSRTLNVVVQAGGRSIEGPTRPVPEGSTSGRAASPAQPIRFSGPFGTSDVEVRGPANSSVLIGERDCWMEIRSGDVIVRLTRREGCRGTAR